MNSRAVKQFTFLNIIKLYISIERISSLIFCIILAGFSVKTRLRLSTIAMNVLMLTQ